MSSSNQNRFSLHYHSYNSVIKQLNQFINAVFILDHYQKTHPKCINFCCTVNTINIMIKFGIIDSHQSLKFLKNILGKKMMLRLIVVSNMLIYLPYKTDNNVLQFCYEKRQ